MQSKLSNYTYHLPVDLVIQIQLLISRALTSIEKFALSLTNVNVWSSLLTYIPSRLFDIFVYWIVLYMLLLELPAINRKMLAPFPFHYHQKNIIYWATSETCFVRLYKSSIFSWYLYFCNSLWNVFLY